MLRCWNDNMPKRQRDKMKGGIMLICQKLWICWRFLCIPVYCWWKNVGTISTPLFVFVSIFFAICNLPTMCHTFLVRANTTPKNLIGVQWSRKSIIKTFFSKYWRKCIFVYHFWNTWQWWYCLKSLFSFHFLQSS